MSDNSGPGKLGNLSRPVPTAIIGDNNFISIIPGLQNHAADVIRFIVGRYSHDYFHNHIIAIRTVEDKIHLLWLDATTPVC